MVGYYRDFTRSFATVFSGEIGGYVVQLSLFVHSLTMSFYEVLEEEDSDELLDRLQESSNKQSIIRNLSSHQIQEALKLAAEYSTRSRHQAIGELEKELTVCPPLHRISCFLCSSVCKLQDSFPPRDVRGFRMLRVKDAQQGNRTLSMRTALLTVWDANSLGTDFFVAGNRYLVRSFSLLSIRWDVRLMTYCVGVQCHSERILEAKQRRSDVGHETRFEMVVKRDSLICIYISPCKVSHFMSFRCNLV